MRQFAGNKFFQRMNRPWANIGAEYTEDFFIYTANLGTNIAAAATVATTFQIDADADFEWLKGTVYANEHGATEPISQNSLIPFTLTIQDSGSGRFLTNVGTPISAFFGSGQLPHILTVPRVFTRMSVISLSATSISANEWDNLYLQFIGRKIFSVNGR